LLAGEAAFGDLGLAGDFDLGEAGLAFAGLLERGEDLRVSEIGCAEVKRARPGDAHLGPRKERGAHSYGEGGAANWVLSVN
jgi:hypothetical protein